MKPAAKSVRRFWAIAALLLLASTSGFGEKEMACSNASLNGHYAFTESGSILDIGPVAVAGIFIADGKCNITANDTVSLNGEIRLEHDLIFTYQVNPDCTGTASSAPGQEHANFNFVIIGNGKEAVGIHIDPARRCCSQQRSSSLDVQIRPIPHGESLPPGF